MSWFSSLVETVKRDIGEFASVVREDTKATVTDVLAGKNVAEAGAVGKILARDEGGASPAAGAGAATAAGPGAVAAADTGAGTGSRPAQAAAVVARLEDLDNEEDLTWDSGSVGGAADDRPAEEAPPAAGAEAATAADGNGVKSSDAPATTADGDGSSDGVPPPSDDSAGVARDDDSAAASAPADQ